MIKLYFEPTLDCQFPRLMPFPQAHTGGRFVAHG